jgi:hypothetical protein
MLRSVAFQSTLEAEQTVLVLILVHVLLFSANYIHRGSLIGSNLTIFGYCTLIGQSAIHGQHFQNFIVHCSSQSQVKLSHTKTTRALTVTAKL